MAELPLEDLCQHMAQGQALGVQEWPLVSLGQKRSVCRGRGVRHSNAKGAAWRFRRATPGKFPVFFWARPGGVA